MYTVKHIADNYLTWGVGADYSNHKRLLKKLAESHPDIDATVLTSQAIYNWASNNWKRPTMLAALQIIKRAWNFAHKPTTLQESTIRYAEKRLIKHTHAGTFTPDAILTGVLTEYDNPLYGIVLNYKNYRREHYEHEEEFFKALLYQCVECSAANWQVRQGLKKIHNKE